VLRSISELRSPLSFALTKPCWQSRETKVARVLDPSSTGMRLVLRPERGPEKELVCAPENCVTLRAMRLRIGSTLILCLFTGFQHSFGRAKKRADTAATIRKLEENGRSPTRSGRLISCLLCWRRISSSPLRMGILTASRLHHSHRRTRPFRLILPKSQISRSGCTGIPQFHRRVPREGNPTEALRVSRPVDGCLDESRQQVAGHLVALQRAAEAVNCKRRHLAGCPEGVSPSPAGERYSTSLSQRILSTKDSAA